MSLNYKTLQAKAKAAINKFGAIACTLRYRDNSTVTTTVVFARDEQKNIDNRQNPTSIIGSTGMKAYIPADIGWVPDPEGKLEYYLGSTKWVKTISKVEVIQPTNTPIMYVLTLE